MTSPGALPGAVLRSGSDTDTVRRGGARPVSAAGSRRCGPRSSTRWVRRSSSRTSSSHRRDHTTSGSRWRRAVCVTRTCRSRRGRSRFMFPTVLGHEGAGVVVEVGDAVTRVVPGDHVVLTWMPACRRCFWCLRGQVMLCEVGLAESLSGAYATVRRNTAGARARHRHLRGGDPRPRRVRWCASTPRCRWSSPPWWAARWPPGWARCGTPPR